MRLAISRHALERALERGASEPEIKEVLESGVSTTAKYGRLGKTKTFEYNRYRSGKLYNQKKVEVYFTVEGDVISIIPVYVFYGTWRDLK